MNASFTDRTIQSAARWYARLQAPDCTPADREEFERWCAADPAHAAAYAAARDMAARLTRLAAFRSAPACAGGPGARRELRPLGAARDAQAPRRRRGARRERRRGFRRRLDARHCAARLPRAATAVRVATADETRMLTLEDGSVVHVDVGSEVEIRFSARERQVVLQRGRAMFDVAHDTSRPFTVVAGSSRVTAVGTRFQVERSPADARSDARRRHRHRRRRARAMRCAPSGSCPARSSASPRAARRG